ncbi:hypothetical protein CYMTET_23223 [Cymbomonas tetramitiformis]|uniref:Uncharacterized protein n=1 Tax=Cymbomonas tetramitiformis TaxID=36881 RepID=A0AAE0L1B6_9CHLO|nr:hypothetical protein CYMTET_23223 [Cymbomonas tetramitiformis]
MAYLDDGHLLGPPVEAAAACGTCVEEAVAIGLHIQPAKSAAYSPEGDPGCFAEEMPGAHAELNFINVLGVPVWKAEAEDAEALRDLVPGGGLASHSHEFATLPHGMRLTEATRAAMQKVAEAMGEINEARGAEKHLPPQSRLPWLHSMTFDNIGPAFLRGIPYCPALELSSAGYRVAVRHVLHAEQPLLGRVGDARIAGGTSLTPPRHCPDVTVLDAEGPGQHVIFDVGQWRMRTLGAAARNVEESKVATCGNVRPHELVPFGVEVYGGLGPAAVAFLKKTQRWFGGRRDMAEDGAEGEEGGEEEDEGAGLGKPAEQSGASPEQARALAEEGATVLLETSRRVLLEGAVEGAKFYGEGVRPQRSGGEGDVLLWMGEPQDEEKAETNDLALVVLQQSSQISEQASQISERLGVVKALAARDAQRQHQHAAVSSVQPKSSVDTWVFCYWEYSAIGNVTHTSKPMCMDAVESIFLALVMVCLHCSYLFIKSMFIGEQLPSPDVLEEDVCSHYDNILSQQSSAVDNGAGIVDDRRKQQELKRKQLGKKVVRPVTGVDAIPKSALSPTWQEGGPTCHRRGRDSKECFITNEAKREEYLKRRPEVRDSLMKKVKDCL